MNPNPETITRTNKPLKANGFSNQTTDVTGYDLSMICTQQDGQKIRSIFPAGTPISEVNAFFRLTGNLDSIRN